MPSTFTSERWAALAGAILLTIALPIAIDQGYFRYNPYVLPALGAVAVLLYSGFFLSSSTARSMLGKFGKKICAVILGVAICLLGWTWHIALEKSKEHIAEIIKKEKPVAVDRSEKTKEESSQSRNPTVNNEKPQVIQPTKLVKPKPIKNPLELVAFNSQQTISIANNGPISVHVMDLLLTLPDPRYSLSHRLDIDIESEKVVSQPYVDDLALQRWTASFGLADTWHEHYQKALALHGACGLGLIFLMSSDTSFQQIKNHYESQGRSLIFTEADAHLHYRIKGILDTETQKVPIVVITAFNADKCSPQP